MDLALLFPGQGSQYVGMGLDLYERIPIARHVFDEADRILGFALTANCFGVGLDKGKALRALTHTAVCQPALYTHSVAIMAALELRPTMVAGHSVGEYSALYASGAISFADGLRLVRKRGELMAQAGDTRQGGMAAVLGMDFSVVETVCARLSKKDQVVVPANYNSSGQVVISGDVEAVEQAASILKAQGARRVVTLNVSGAFHSPLMEPISAELARELEVLDIREPSCPIYLNVTAEPTRDPENIREQMLKQLNHPVRWAQILQAMPSDTHFIEVGPGRVLSGLVRRTLGRTAQVQAIGKADQVEKVQNQTNH